MFLLIIFALYAFTHFTFMLLPQCRYLQNSFRFRNDLCIICENCSQELKTFTLHYFITFKHYNNFIRMVLLIIYTLYAMHLCFSALMIYALNARMFLGMANNLCIK